MITRVYLAKIREGSVSWVGFGKIWILISLLASPEFILAQVSGSGGPKNDLFFPVTLILGVAVLVLGVLVFRMKGLGAKNAQLEKEVRDLSDQLDETKVTLENISHKASMADSTTGVLHNIGNILNSANTCAGVIRGVLSKSVGYKLMKANGLLKSHIDHFDEFIANDPKAIPLLKYYLELEVFFQEENKELSENTSRLIEKIRAIKEAIAAQQRIAKGHGFITKLQLKDVVEDALMLQTGSIGRHEITVIKKYDERMPDIKLEKTKVVQILMNLYKNAKESMDDFEGRENILTIKIYKDDEYGYVSVNDSGHGIDNEKLQGVFDYGFSTKEDGHGFGLHSCLNYMNEMGGKIWAESDGIGQGATFILAFPLKPELESEDEEGEESEEE